MLLSTELRQLGQALTIHNPGSTTLPPSPPPFPFSCAKHISNRTSNMSCFFLLCLWWWWCCGGGMCCVCGWSVGARAVWLSRCHCCCCHHLLTACIHCIFILLQMPTDARPMSKKRSFVRDGIFYAELNAVRSLWWCLLPHTHTHTCTLPQSNADHCCCAVVVVVLFALCFSAPCNVCCDTQTQPPKPNLHLSS